MSKILKKQKLSTRLDNVRKEINEAAHADVTKNIREEFSGDTVIQTSRVMSEDASHFILIKGLSKKRREEEIAKAQQQQEDISVASSLGVIEEEEEEKDNDTGDKDDQLLDDSDEEKKKKEKLNEISWIQSKESKICNDMTSNEEKLNEIDTVQEQNKDTSNSNISKLKSWQVPGSDIVNLGSTNQYQKDTKTVVSSNVQVESSDDSDAIEITGVTNSDKVCDGANKTKSLNNSTELDDIDPEDREQIEYMEMSQAIQASLSDLVAKREANLAAAAKGADNTEKEHNSKTTDTVSNKSSEETPYFSRKKTSNSANLSETDVSKNDKTQRNTDDTESDSGITTHSHI